MTIDLLCKVVDNYGDIGVVYRLAKALTALRPGLRLRILVDRVDVFAALLPDLDPALVRQVIGNWTILDWNHPWEGILVERPRFVIEAFACGRPDWYEAILIDPLDQGERLHLVLEYLSAEPYADEFHLLPSPSPLSELKKIYFMPGFSPQTGGLIHDPAFLASRNRWTGLLPAGAAREQALAELGISVPLGCGGDVWVCLFSYEHDYRGLVADLATWQKETGRAVLVLAAAGRSQAGFRSDWQAGGQPFKVVWLPFLNQELWDEVLLACDWSIIRGEESLSRAALAGRPFVWHAYLQDEGYQKVKVAALIDAMVPLLVDGVGAAVDSWRSLMQSFNQRIANSARGPSRDPWLPFLRNMSALAPGFRCFAEKLEFQGDCASKVLSLMDDFG